MRGNISIWVYIYILAHALFSLAMGVVAYIDPAFQFTGLLQTSSVMHPIGLYANRNFAIAIASIVAVIYGLRTRRPYQLTSIALILLLTDLSDIILLLFRGDAPVVMLLSYAILFYLPETFILVYLYKRFRPRRKIPS